VLGDSKQGAGELGVNNMGPSHENGRSSWPATGIAAASPTVATIDAGRAVHRHEFDVFLSHSSLDKPAVEELARYLTRQNLRPWLDKWNLVPGEPWQEALEAALADCATCAVFIGPSGTGPWQNEEMRSAIDRRVADSDGRFRVIPVLLPGAQRGDRSRLPGFLSRTTWVEFRHSLDEEDALHRLVAGVRGLAPGPAPGREPYGDTCPYRGLEVFDVQDARFFFGREALTEWLLNALPASPGRLDQANRFLAVIGPSGSGKSSLARAGLVAGLQAGRLEGSAAWSVVICRPGADPLESLAVALSDVTSPGQSPGAVADLMRALRTDERTLHLTTRLAFKTAPHERRLVVFVDQFEEIFTACHDESLRRSFLDNLLYAATVAQGQTLVLVTMRADFYGKCAAYPELAAALSDHQLLVGPMSEDELRQAIERPAQRTGCEFEPGLVDVLVRDVQGEAGGLPLLQYALRELWFRRAGRRLTHAAYQEIGGVGGALEHAAEAAYAQFTASEQAVSRHIFLRLTQPGEGTEDTRRRASFDELLSQSGESDLVEEVVETLTDTRLLTTSADEKTADRTVDIAHEALLRAWPRLRAWIDEDRAGLRTLRRLTEAARDWLQAKRDPDLLYRGARLAVASEWRTRNEEHLTDLEREFMDASVGLRVREEQAEKQRQERELEAERQRAETAQAFALSEKRGRARQRYLSLALAPLFVGASIAALFAFSSRHDALEAQQAAQQQARAQATAEAHANEQKEVAESAAAAQATAEARAVADRDIAQQQRSEAIAQTQIAISRQLAAQSITHLADQLDLALLLSLEGYRTQPTIEARDAMLRALEFAPSVVSILHQSSAVTSVAFSPNGMKLASGGVDKTIQMWDATTHQPQGPPWIAHSDRVASVVFSRDGNTLASAGLDGALRLWSVVSHQQLGATMMAGRAPITSVAFSPDGRTIVSGSVGGTVRNWDVASQKPIGVTNLPRNVDGVAISPDGTIIAVGTSDGSVRFLDSATEKDLAAPMTGHSGRVNTLAFSPDGAVLVSGGSDGTLRLWDVARRESLESPLVGHAGPVTSVAFSPDGAILASAGQDKTVRLWDVVSREPLGSPLTGHTMWVEGVAFSPDGQTLASASFDGGVWLWDVAHHQTLSTPLTGHMGSVDSVAISPDNKILASGSDDKTVRLWDLTSRQSIAPPLIGHTAMVQAVAFSPDDRTLASADAAGNVKLWDETNHQPLATEVPIKGTSVAYSPDGRLLAAGFQGRVSLWELGSHELLDGLGVANPVFGLERSSLAFSPDGKLLAAGSGLTFELWDTGTHQMLAGERITNAYPPDRTSVSFSPDGRLLAWAGSDQTIRLWDVSRRQYLGLPLSGHSDYVTSIAFSPDGKSLASASLDKTVRLWDVATGEAIGTPLTGHDAAVEAVAFSSDGSLVVSGSQDHTVRLWDVSPESWAIHACKIANRNLTQAEWATFMAANVAYRRTCPDLPPGNGATVDQ
jgi:WD40 repeat protein